MRGLHFTDVIISPEAKRNTKWPKVGRNTLTVVVWIPMKKVPRQVAVQKKAGALSFGMEKVGKNFRVKGTGQFSSVKMERDERVPFTPSYVKKT